MINPHIKYTVRDYMSLPESEEKRYELIDGEIIMVPSPARWHQRAAVRITTALENFVRPLGIGEVYSAPFDVVLSDKDVFQPDIIFVSSQRESILTDANIQGGPDLVVEILSPSTGERDKSYKMSTYARFGVREYWIVDTAAKSIEVMGTGRAGFETVRVYPGGTTLRSPVLEGLELDIAGIFE